MNIAKQSLTIDEKYAGTRLDALLAVEILGMQCVASIWSKLLSQLRMRCFLYREL